MTDDNRQSDKIIDRAEIYKVEFAVGSKNYIYIGLDTKCDPNYFGSSLVIYHYQRVFGNSLFQKEILEELSNISYTELCAIEQKYIRESKAYAQKNNYYSINYTGSNRRESGPKIDIPVLGEQIINEAKLIGLDLRVASQKLGIMKPTFPPAPFDKASGGGMHIETNYGLRRIGFSFFRERGSDHNIGLATAILRDLEFDDDSISTLGPADLSDYQYVLAIHNSRDPKHLADLFKRLVDMVVQHPEQFINEPSARNTPQGWNRPLPEKDKVDQARASCGGSDYTIKRYKDSSIRIIKDGEDNPVNNTRAIMSEINEEYDLGFIEHTWKGQKVNTRSQGKRMIDLLNNRKEND
jgi:hypothetical protein